MCPNPDHTASPSDTTPSAGGGGSWLIELARTFLPAVLIVVSINLFLAQPRTVHGESMEPNLHENQRVILDLVSYRFREPQRGEIVVIRFPGERKDPLIKRVVALAGETVEIRSGVVYVDGVKLDEPYLDYNAGGSMASLVVPADHVFVLGDNRGRSNDSRYFGAVSMRSILGRAWLCYWPPDKIALLH